MYKNKFLINSILLLLVVVSWIVYESTPYLEQRQQTMVIEKGQTLSEVAKKLEQNHIIKNKQLFILYGKLKNLDNEIQAGKHTVVSNQFYKQIYEELVAPSSEKGIEVTIPEGFTVQEIAERLQTKGITNKHAFLKLVKTGEKLSHPVVATLKTHKELEYRLEGFLFPDTYYFKKGLAPEKVINRMLDRFKEVTEEIKPSSNVDVYQWITLASIVEKEAVVDKERPIIAGVFKNRLKIDWKLQSCATVQYVLDKPKERLMYSDLEVKSPYNTYINEGLPPGPISNPGKSSMQAALKAKNHEYLFFVVKEDGSGKHHFNKSYKEHQQFTNHKGNW